MSKYLSSASLVALMAAASPANAQDMDWTGIYGGVHGAVVDANPQWDGTSIYQTVDGGEGGFTTELHSVPFTEEPSGSEIGGGARIGYNWQSGNFVFGGEADATFFDLNAVETGTNAAGTYTVMSHATNLETIRARAGVAFGSAMLFTTGGVAFSNLDHSLAATNVSQIVVDGGEGGSTIGTLTSNLAASASGDTGWAAGGGGEVRLNDNLSLALTLLHVDFGSEELADSDAPNAIGATVDTSFFIGTLGLNLKF